MKIEENEMLFVYNSNDLSDRAALAYAKASPEYKLREFDVTRTFFTETQLKEVANKLNLRPKDLIDELSEVYVKKYRDTKLSEDDVLVALKHEPTLLRTPIVLYEDGGEFVGSRYAFVKRGMNSPVISSRHANKEERSH